MRTIQCHCGHVNRLSAAMVAALALNDVVRVPCESCHSQNELRFSDETSGTLIHATVGESVRVLGRTDKIEAASEVAQPEGLFRFASSGTFEFTEGGRS